MAAFHPAPPTAANLHGTRDTGHHPAPAKMSTHKDASWPEAYISRASDARQTDEVQADRQRQTARNAAKMALEHFQGVEGALKSG